jgi:hypothetical protein
MLMQITACAESMPHGVRSTFSPRGNRGTRVGVWIARLPDQFRQRRRKMCHVLAGAAGDFKHYAGCGQYALQNRENRLAIAFGGGGMLAHRGIGWSHVQ